MNLTASEQETFFDISIEVYDYINQNNITINMRLLPSIAYELSNEFEATYQNEMWKEKDYLDTLIDFVTQNINKHLIG